MNRDLPNLECTQCGKLRAWDDIAVLSRWLDFNGHRNAMQRNINYCADNLTCRLGAYSQMERERAAHGWAYSINQKP